MVEKVIKRPTSPQGNWSDKIKEAVERPYKGNSGGLPERTSRYSAGNLNKARPPDSIRMNGPKNAMTTTPKPEPLGERPLRIGGPKGSAPSAVGRNIAGTIAKGAWRWAGGPAAALVGMTQPVDEGGDKPTGKVMKGNASVGGGRRVAAGTPTAAYEPKASSPKLSRNPADSWTPPSKSKPVAPKAAAAPIPKAKPAAPKAAAPIPKAKPAAPKAAPKSGFSGNWIGAAPTEMQKRGGARTKETPYQRMMRNAREK